MADKAPEKEQLKAEEEKLSNAERKKRDKAEKQARRAAQKGQQPEVPQAGAAPAALNGVNGASSSKTQDAGSPQKPQQQQKLKPEKQPQGQPQNSPSGSQQGETHHRRSGSQPQPLPIRPHSSQPAQPQRKAATKKDNKQVEMFGHLYTQPRRHTIEGVNKDVHPAVLAAGLQMSSYEICGSSARCVAMLLAFKEAIHEYTTPAGTSLARHLTSHYLSPQIEFLKSCRPISESMGNAIRWLKKLIVEIDPNMPEQEAKDELCEKIDTFIRERITVSDQAIAESARQQIKNGSVVLTFAKSSIVEKTILQAHSEGRRFRVIIVDSRPLFEGKKLATSLMKAGLEIEYLPFSAISHAVKSATLVLLGAHSMLSNGRLQSRIGTASVAMQAAKRDIPVVVCCESVKFSGKVALDSIVLNEVAPAEELLLSSGSDNTSPSKEDASDEGAESKIKTLSDWKDIPNLQMLNLMYDVTPAEYIRIVICEYGSVPPSSVPVVHRLANEATV